MSESVCSECLGRHDDLPDLAAIVGPEVVKRDALGGTSRCMWNQQWIGTHGSFGVYSPGRIDCYVEGADRVRRIRRIATMRNLPIITEGNHTAVDSKAVTEMRLVLEADDDPAIRSCRKIIK